MHTITLSGWGQPHDALAVIAPDATPVDYVHAANAGEVFRMLSAHKPERIIGWSLGGQLALRAVAEGVVQPKQLVLIATPYQFVTAGDDSYQKFEANYVRDPKRTLDKAWDLIHYNDTRSRYIKELLLRFDKEVVLKRNWLRWLRILAAFSGDVLDLSVMPRTLIVHGKEDVVVRCKQSEFLLNKIPSARRVLWEGCGHAPHFHDAAKLRDLINEHADV